MKAAVAALAPIFTVGGLSVMVGIAYIADCRISKGTSFDSCWLTGANFMNIGGGAIAGGALGWRAGFNTLNPALRRDGSGAPAAPQPARNKPHV